MNQTLIDQYKKIHKEQNGYGSGFGRGRYFEEMVEFLNSNACLSVLDFGCGKGVLKEELSKLGFICGGYDPAIKEFSAFPSSNYDAVISTDVFEHLDKNNIHEEFDLIKSVDPKYLYFNIATNKAGQTLPNGLNAHTIIENGDWWEQTILDNFNEYNIHDKFTQKTGAASVVISLKKKNA